MGQRANLIIKQGCDYWVYYTHWRANTLDRDLFWGPYWAEAFIRAQQPMQSDEWLDDVWAEGGAVLDKNHDVLLLFGGEDIMYDIPLRRVYLELLQRVWKDWDIRWAHEGIADLADHVNYPRDLVLAPQQDDGLKLEAIEPSREFFSTVTTVRYAERDMRVYPLLPRVESLMQLGPKLVQRLQELAGTTQLWLDQPKDYIPHSGLHIDAPQRLVEFWESRDLPGVVDRIAPGWSDWRVIWHRDRFEAQLSAVGDALRFPQTSEHDLVESIRQIVLRQDSRSGVELVIDAAKHLEHEGHELTKINALALRDAQLTLPQETRASIFEEALRQWLRDRQAP